ncbi:unnamed protein product [Ixodes pacificus]
MQGGVVPSREQHVVHRYRRPLGVLGKGLEIRGGPGRVLPNEFGECGHHGPPDDGAFGLTDGLRDLTHRVVHCSLEAHLAAKPVFSAHAFVSYTTQAISTTTTTFSSVKLKSNVKSRSVLSLGVRMALA